MDDNQSPYFINNPQIIKMHLDIIYKSVSFLSEDKIDQLIKKYLENIEKNKREEENQKMLEEL